jgi:hypothetical protein
MSLISGSLRIIPKTAAMFQRHSANLDQATRGLRHRTTPHKSNFGVSLPTIALMGGTLSVILLVLDIVSNPSVDRNTPSTDGRNLSSTPIFKIDYTTLPPGE